MTSEKKTDAKKRTLPKRQSLSGAFLAVRCSNGPECVNYGWDAAASENLPAPAQPGEDTCHACASAPAKPLPLPETPDLEGPLPVNIAPPPTINFSTQTPQKNLSSSRIDESYTVVKLDTGKEILADENGIPRSGRELTPSPYDLRPSPQRRI